VAEYVHTYIRGYNRKKKLIKKGAGGFGEKKRKKEGKKAWGQSSGGERIIGTEE